MSDVGVEGEGVAKVRFERHGGSSLPRICIVCGERDCRFTEVYIPVLPAEGNLTPGGVEADGSRVVGLRMEMPLCPDHESHFFWPNMIRYGLIAGIIALVLLIMVIGSALKAIWMIPVGMVVMLASAIGGIILLARLNRGNVHISDISRRSITFSNVSREFARAFDEDDGDGGERRRRDEDDDDDEPRRRSTKNLGVGKLLAAFGILFGIVTIIIVIGLLATSRAWGPLGALMGGRPDQGKQDGGKPGPKPEPKPEPKPDPKPVIEPEEIRKLAPTPLKIDASWKEAGMQRRYLSDMPEEGVITAWGAFGKNGRLGYPAWSPDPAAGNDPILFNGKAAPKGISFIPRETSFGRVIYKLGGQEKLFTGAAAMSDMPERSGVKQSEAPMWFTVWGDGKLLWKSRAIQKVGDSEPFRLAVTGVDVLELRVLQPGRGTHSRNVWLDPAVYR